MSGTQTSYFLMKDRTVKACGRNVFGELGLGHKNEVVIPTTIPNLNNVKQILYGGYSATFLLKDGTAYLAGSNIYNNFTGRTEGELVTPTIMPKMVNIKSMDGLGKGYVLTLKNGSVKIYSANNFTKLGSSKDYTTDLFDLPITDNVKKMVISEYHTAILFNDGTVKMAGYNSDGQLGVGNFTQSYPTFQNTRISNVKDVFLPPDSSSSYFLLNDGTVYSCGVNLNGALGLGHTSSIHTPTKISINNVKDVICCYYSVFFIKEDNSVWVCGYNENGKLGLGHKNAVYSPVLNPYITNYKKIVVSDKHCHFLTNDGKVYGFGDDTSGQLGLGTKTGYQYKPVLIPIEGVIDFESNRISTTLNVNLTNTSPFDYNKNEGNFLFDINITESSDNINNYTIQENSSDKPIFTNNVNISEFPHTINERIPISSLRDGVNQINVTVESGDSEIITKMYLIKGKEHYTWFDKLVKLKKTTNVKDNNLLLKLNSNGKVIPFTLHDNGEINLVKQQELIPVDKNSSNIQIGFVMEKTTELNSYGIAWL